MDSQIDFINISYNWETVNSFLKKIYYIFSYKDSMCDKFNMECIVESLKNCSKGVLQHVQNCTNISGNKGIGFIFEKTFHHLDSYSGKQTLVITNKSERKS